MYDFDESKQEVESRIWKIINTDSQFVLPSKWDYYKSAGPPLPVIPVYFKNNPEEVYELRFAEGSKRSCRLGIIFQSYGDEIHYGDALNSKEIKRICRRFELEILSKVGYKYYKID